MCTLNVPVQSVAAVHGAAMNSRAVHRRRGAHGIERATDLLQNALRGNVRTVQVHCKVVKTNLFEALKNDIQRSTLLGNKENPLAGAAMLAIKLTIVWLLPVPGGP